MIVVRDILTELWLILKLSECVIGSDGGTFKGSTTHMVYFGAYVFKDLNTG